MSKQEVNALIDDLIRIKDWHRSELSMDEVNTINKACNALEELAYE